MSENHRSIVRRDLQPKSASRPVVSPIWPSVVYASADADALDDQYEGRTQGYVYGREGHPNWSILADKLDWMEGAENGVVTSSGMAAVGAVFKAALKTGDHLVAGNQLYGRTLRMLREEMPRIGVGVTLADPTDGRAFAAAIGPETRLVLVEVVSNPTLRVADMETIAAACREKGVLMVVDNTFTTPRLYRPFEHGADVVIHSVTKMLAGHSDVTLGYAAARDADLAQRLYDVVVTWGMTPSPFDCWLAERGLHSFDVRFDRAEANAAALADHLAGLEGVEAVLYPGRADHPDHNRAVALLGGPEDNRGGNMVSFRLKGGRTEVNRFLRAAEHIAFAPTLGDIGTTLSHPASSSHRGLTPEGRAALGITEGFIRVSVGIEEIELLQDELAAAVAASREG